jgi:hypothetical protein
MEFGLCIEMAFTRLPSSNVNDCQAQGIRMIYILASHGAPYIGNPSAVYGTDPGTPKYRQGFSKFYVA